MPGAAEPACSFELSQLGWGTGSAASSGALAGTGDTAKAKAAACSFTRPVVLIDDAAKSRKRRWSATASPSGARGQAGTQLPEDTAGEQQAGHPRDLAQPRLSGHQRHRFDPGVA